MNKKALSFAILVSALGYFVDVYDIILFSTVRVPSLRSLGLPEDEITTISLKLINIQLVGMLLGGITWGILGDKKGRLSILFGSILLYSSATLANAFVTNIETYAILRFIAGFGLAGELGGGITLVNELMSKEKRGLGTMIIVTSGIFGGIAGGLIGNFLPWQTAYIIGGLAGFFLLLLRMGVKESTLFNQIKNEKEVSKGNLLLFLKNPALLMKFLKCIAVGAPFWIFIGLFMAFAPELGQALNVSGPITAAWAILYFNIGLGLGDLSSSLLSQILSTRKKVVMIYLTLTSLVVISFLSLKEPSVSLFYFFCAALGLSSGSWALFIMLTTEQFGTNLRATVSASTPNFVRGMVIPFSLVLAFLKPKIGILWGLGLISLTCLMVAIMAICSLKETFATDLNFTEK